MDFEKDQRFRYIFHRGKQLYPERCFESSHFELVKNFFFLSGSVNVLWILRGSLEVQKAIPAHSQGRTCSKEVLLEVPGEVHVKMWSLYSWEGRTGHFSVILSGQLGLKTYEKRVMLWKDGSMNEIFHPSCSKMMLLSVWADGAINWAATCMAGSGRSYECWKHNWIGAGIAPPVTLFRIQSWGAKKGKNGQRYFWRLPFPVRSTSAFKAFQLMLRWSRCLCLRAWLRSGRWLWSRQG